MLPPPPASLRPPGSPHDALRPVCSGSACARADRRGPGLRRAPPGGVGAWPGGAAAGKQGAWPGGAAGGRRRACGSRSKAVRAKASGSSEAEAERAPGPGRRRGLPGGESRARRGGPSGAGSDSRLSAERRRARNGGASSAKARRLLRGPTGLEGRTSCASAARSSLEPQRCGRAHASASSCEERRVGGTCEDAAGFSRGCAAARLGWSACRGPAQPARSCGTWGR